MKKHTVLYVEDEQWTMEGVTDSLKADYEVLTARNADQALAILESEANRSKISVIVLDIMMPLGERIRDNSHGRKAGVEFAKEILTRRNYTIPIVCYTVVDDAQIFQELSEIGVKEIVSKDQTPKDLKEIINELLK